MFDSSSRTDKPTCTKLGMLIPWDQEENTERSKLRKSALSSSTGEGGSGSSETKHDRRMAPKPKLFVSARRLQEQRLWFRKLLGSNPAEDGFCSSETKHDRRTAPRPKLFVPARRLQEQQLRFRKLLGSSPGEDGFCSSRTKHDRRTAQITKLLVSAKRLQEQRSETRKLSWVRASVKMLGLGIMMMIAIIIIIIILNDMYRMIRHMVSFRAIKTVSKCKHLSNFPAVIMRALC
jgi:hypothetical protein